MTYQIRRRRGIYIVPNLITTGNLASGFYSLISTIDGQYVTAAFAIIIAGIFDCLDGRAARLTKTTSKFGVEYDSLSDVVSFGVAPAILIYSWGLHSFGHVGWLAAFLFMVCGALRLARFNVQITTVEKKHFTGMPIPSAAGMIASTILINDYFNNFMGAEKPFIIVLMTYILAFLMVSNIPYGSFKSFNLIERKPFSALVSSVLFIIVLAARPQITLFTVGVLYTSSGIVMAVVNYFKNRHGRVEPHEDEVEKEVSEHSSDIEDREIVLD